ncbi:MAG TPA: NIPSNAP family protein [Gemmatirosa sp.]
MQRREFLSTSLAGAALSAAGVSVVDAAPSAALTRAAMTAGAPATREVYELRTDELRNDLDVGRSQEFFGQQLVPALRRAGASAVGAFTPDSGLPQPSLVLLVAYPSLAAVDAASERLAGDAMLRAAMDAWERPAAGAAGASHGVGLPYVRYEVSLYRAFPGHAALELPAAAAGRAPRLFELRTYEAPSDEGLRAKVAMFDEAEIRIFRDSGFAPVMFGTAIAGARLPHLTYLVGFDDMAARGAAWGRFGSNPEWQRIRVRPGWTDPETVSVIHSAFLRPTAFSDVR